MGESLKSPNRRKAATPKKRGKQKSHVINGELTPCEKRE